MEEKDMRIAVHTIENYVKGMKSIDDTPSKVWEDYYSNANLQKICSFPTFLSIIRNLKEKYNGEDL